MSLDRPAKKALLIRLSSLGDVAMTTGALASLPGTLSADWLIGSAFEGLLRGHPRVRKLWVFDRKAGLRGWLALGRALYQEDYSDVYDLHATLRSRILRLQFLFYDLLSGRRRRWSRIEKSRWKLWGYFVFKRWWPARWRPRHLIDRVAATLARGGPSAFPRLPDLRHLLKNPMSRVDADFPVGEYYCVMPSSRWRSKEWSAEKFRDLIEMLPGTPVILGQPRDRNSARLVELLASSDHPHVSGLGKWDLRETATVLARGRFMIGVDTGLSHLAQAIGVPTLMIFGPTVPDMGFGPWAPSSAAAEKDIVCRPCGKDGRICQRFWQPYHCLRGLDVASVLESLRKILPKTTSRAVLEFPKA